MSICWIDSQAIFEINILLMIEDVKWNLFWLLLMMFVCIIIYKSATK